MSVPHINLSCEKCATTSGTVQLYGSRIYRDGDLEIPLRCTLGWCQSCENLRAVEHFDDADQIRKDICNLDAELSQYCSTFLQRLLNRLKPAYRKNRIWQKAQRDALIRRLELIGKRRGDEACLTCGSRQIREFDGDCKLEMGDNFLYRGSKRTGFLHPGCGGEFIAEACDFRFHLARITKCYSVDGVLVDEYRS